MARSAESLINDAANDALKLAIGEYVVSLDDMAPATFNRFGADTNGNWAVTLVHQIATTKGFFDAKYWRGYAVKPSSADPTVFARHGNQMVARDSLLPTYDMRPLMGVFKCTHLMTGLQIQKKGDRKVPETDIIFAQKLGNTAHQHAMQHGLRMLVFEFDTVMANYSKFEALMATDNMDSDLQLPEDELSVIVRMNKSARTITPTVGETLDSAVLKLIRFNGSRLHSDEDLCCYLDIAKSSAEAHLRFLKCFQKFICNPQLFCVAPETFRKIAHKISPDAGWFRVAMLVFEWSADRKRIGTEVQKLHSGKMVAANLKDKDFCAASQLPRKRRLLVESHLHDVVVSYFENVIANGVAVADNALVREVGAFLRRAFLLIVRGGGARFADSSDQDILDELVRFEYKMRAKLVGYLDLPPPCRAQPAEPQDGSTSETPQNKKIKLSNAASSTVPLISFNAEGKAVDNNMAKAVTAGFLVGTEVQLKKPIVTSGTELPADTRLWIVSVTPKGIRVTTTQGAKEGFDVTFGALKLSEYIEPKKEKDKVERRMPPMPVGVGFQLASLDQSKEVVRCLAINGLYKLQTSCGSGPTQLRMCSDTDKPVLYANAKAKERTLALIPFSTDLRLERNSDASVPNPEIVVPIKCRIELHGRVQKFEYWAYHWQAHGAIQTTTGDVPAAVATFWYAHHCEATDDGVRLLKETREVSLNFSTSCEDRPLRKGGPTANIIMEVPYLTNGVEVIEGEKLFAIEG